MAAPWPWDTTKPDGSEDPGTLDDILRTQFKVPLDEFFKSFSNFPTDGKLLEGTARITVDVAANLPASGDEGQLFYATDTLRLYLWDGSAWVDIPLGARRVEVALFGGGYIPVGTGGAWRDLPYCVMSGLALAETQIWPNWEAGQGIRYHRDHYPSTAQHFLRGLVFGHKRSVDLRLWDVTANAAVAGSEVIGTSAINVESLRTPTLASFDMAGGDRLLRAQVRQSNAAGSLGYVFQVSLEIGW